MAFCYRFKLRVHLPRSKLADKIFSFSVSVPRKCRRFTRGRWKLRICYMREWIVFKIILNLKTVQLAAIFINFYSFWHSVKYNSDATLLFFNSSHWCLNRFKTERPSACLIVQYTGIYLRLHLSQIEVLFFGSVWPRMTTPSSLCSSTVHTSCQYNHLTPPSHVIITILITNTITSIAITNHHEHHHHQQASRTKYHLILST